MDKIVYQLDRIATALETIARKLPQSSLEFTPEPVNQDIQLSSTSPNFLSNSPMLPEEELFIRTTNIYLDETIRKHKENLKRKSAIRVSQNLISMQISFLDSNLPEFDIDEYSSAVLVISKNKTPKALVRIYTDLGFHRGNSWRRDMTEITKIASNLNIPVENIFLIAITNWNGLDNSHVCSTLGFNISNKDILDIKNQNILKDYCKLYINSFSDIFPNPENQIHFLTGELHPNVVAENINKDKNIIIDLKNYQWLSTPLANIFSYINTL